MNLAIVAGKVTRDPFFNQGTDGKPSVLKVDVEAKNRERSTYVVGVLFGLAADANKERFQEGDNVLMDGEMRLNTYNKDYPKLEISVGSITKIDNIEIISDAFGELAQPGDPAEESGLDF